MYILGINAFHGDAAAALVKDELIAAEEGRLNRVKHCAGFPAQSIEPGALGDVQADQSAP